MSDIKRIPRAQHTYLFGPDQAPVAELVPGETVVFETWDALGGRVKTRADAVTLVLPPEQLNPATGPVYVVGAQPGDTLAVTILDIQLGERGQSRIRTGMGVIIDQLRPPAANVIPVRDGVVYFNDRIRFPTRPMVGVIGTAPGRASIPSFNPGDHGGNLDFNDLGVGATIYLPVRVPGALLAIGDVHASMGDGELTGGGIDINADVTVRIELLSNLAWQRPVIETEHIWCTCASAPDLATAIRYATGDMVALIARQLDMSPEESFMLIGTTGDGRLGQAAQAGIDVTACVHMPKAILPTVF